MRILIIDDSLIHGRKLSNTLTSMGHEVVGHARNGTEGVKLFEEHKPELTICDIVMPEMDGLSTLRIIRSKYEQAKVVMLTSTAGVGGNVEKAIKIGAMGVLAKPISDEDLQQFFSNNFT